MRTLLIEPLDGAPEVAAALRGAGHEIVRCHEPGAPAFPCVGLAGDGCPLEAHDRPVDVAVALPHRDRPEAADGGATCALRGGVPLVLVGGADDPLAPWATLAAEPTPGALDAAAQGAIAEAADRRAWPLRREAKRVLRQLDVDAGDVSVEVARRGDTADITVRTDRPLDSRTASAVAARVHAVDRTRTWPTSKLTVSLASGD